MSRRAAPIARRLLALGAMAAAGGAARAEDAPAVIAPLQVEPDRNEVNLHDGKTRIELPALSVPAAPNLRFDRLQNAAPYFTARVYTPTGSEHDSRSYAIHIGAESSDAIDCYDDACTSVTGSGAIFDWRHRNYRQAGSGVFWQFNAISVHTASPNEQWTVYGTTATYPNGEAIGFEYDTAAPNLPFNRVLHRPRKLTSSLGYYIAITYADNGDPLSSDWSRVTEAALYRDGATPTLLRRFTYSGATIRDHGASTAEAGRDYICTGCVNGLGAEIEISTGSMQLPGESSPALQVAPFNSDANPVVGAVTRDGVGWSYSYVNLRLQPGTLRWLFDRMTVNGPNGFQQVYDVSNSYHSIYDQATNRVHTTITSATTRVSDTVSRSTSYYYDFYDRPTRIVYPELNEVSVVYDGYGNITSRTSTPKPGGGAPITEYASFPSAACGDARCYRPSWTRDGLGRQTDYSYDGSGQLTEQLDPADAKGVRRRISTTYQASTGGISRRSAVRICADTGTSCGTSAPVQTEYDYGWSALPLLPSAERRIDVAQSPVVTLTTLFTYDSAGRLTMTDGPLPGGDDATYYRYDDYGRRTWEIGARSAATGLRIATRTTYRDSDDKAVSTETGTIPDADSTNLSVFRRTDVAYDNHRNPVREAVSAGGTTYGVVDKAYDDQGRLTCTAIRMNPAAFAATPGACALGTQGGAGPDRIASTSYDAAGQRLQLREAVGTADEGTEATWAYNLNGQVTTVIDGNGNRAELRYDGYGRQDRWTFPSAIRPTAYNDATQATALATAGAVNAGDYEEYTYDAVGNRTNLRKRDGRNIAFAYDALNRVISKTYPQGGATPVYYSYDLQNLQLSARFTSQSGEGIASTYDGFGRQLTSTSTMAGTSRMLSYGYDPDGNRIRITHPDLNRFETDYDALGRPTMLRANEYTAMAGMGYYAHGGPAGRSLANSSTSEWGYDAVQRPTAVVQNAAGTSADLFLSLSYNPAGQIASRTLNNDAYAWTGHYAVNRPYTTDGRNQYTAAGGASFGYDLNGNLTSDGSRTYTYDIENRLVSSSNGAALTYDPLGRLFQISLGAATTQFLYDGDALVAEYNGSNVVQRRYVHWVGADVPLLSYAGATLNQPSYLHADQQGSIVMVSDQAGNPSINRFDEFGIPQSTNTGRFQYTGQAYLAELGLYYYKARIYSPTLGRFMQTDPVGYGDQFNLYAYALNDPVNATDPSGAAVVMARDGNNIHLTFYIAYYGRGNTREVRDRFNHAITAAWSGRFGRYNVNTSVVSYTFRQGTEPASRNYPSRLNFINLFGGRHRNDPEQVRSGRNATMGANRPDWTAAHLAGHFANLDEGLGWDGTALDGNIDSIMEARDQPVTEDTISDVIAANSGRGPRRGGDPGREPPLNIDTRRDICNFKGCRPGEPGND